MTDLWPIPSGPHELRELEVRVKPDWRGLGWVVGIVLWLGEHLHIVVALLGALAGVGFAMPRGAWLSVPAIILAAVALVALGMGARKYATKILDEYVQQIGDGIYAQRGRDLHERPLSEQIIGHESIHDWLARKHGQILFALLLGLSKWRLHNEAMAQGYEVAVWGKPLEDAVDS